MNFDALRRLGQQNLPAENWEYFDGTADGDVDRDSRAWARWDLVPRVLTGLNTIDTSITLADAPLESPLIIAPTASQGAAHPEAELATRRAAAALGLLCGYSFHATIDVKRFAAAAPGAPWCAQVYALRDRVISDDYLRRCADLGAAAVILTVDVPGTLADAPFRARTMSAPVKARGNHLRDDDGAALEIITESCLRPDEIERTAQVSGLPVWIKGIMTGTDAVRCLDAGAAGVFVSNHGRRQLAGVAPTAAVLRSIVEAVGGRAPVLVDGGIRSGTDAVRALALGASAVAIGRPVPWALAAGGEPELFSTLTTLTDEVRVALAGLGAGSVSDLEPGMVQQTFLGA